MKKYITDLTIKQVEYPSESHVLLRLTDEEKALPEMKPGQFVEIKVDGASDTFLRRPISVNFVDKEQNELWLLIHAIGEGTRRLASMKKGEKLNVVLPLGNGFSMPLDAKARPLLVGGGVGTAPMLYAGKVMKDMGIEPTFLLGAKTKADILQIEDFEKLGRVLVTTEDESMGEKGFVTQHSALHNEQFTAILTCGPKPMMMAVAKYAKEVNVPCEVSLENMMACGVGACLCCVEKTVKGNVCVCKEGPVFNINDLIWQI